MILDSDSADSKWKHLAVAVEVAVTVTVMAVVVVDNEEFAIRELVFFIEEIAVVETTVVKLKVTAIKYAELVLARAEGGKNNAHDAPYHRQWDGTIYTRVVSVR